MNLLCHENLEFKYFAFHLNSDSICNVCIMMSVYMVI